MLKARLVRRILFITVLVSFGGYVLYSGFFFLMQREFYFPGRHIRISTPVTPPAGCTVFRLDTGGDTVEAWFLRPISRVPEKGFPVMIVAHGNGGIMYSWAGKVKTLVKDGMAVLLVEYPGYAQSGGSPSYESLIDIFIKAYDRLTALPDVDTSHIYGFGYSFGGAAVCALAQHRELRALILLSTFTSLYDMAISNGLPPFLVLDPFNSLEILKRYHGPVLILHGRDDEIIPYSHAERLARAAKNAKLITLTGGHTTQVNDWDLFWSTYVRNFLENTD
jgi:pimeloyl-ACP methyl ester carboxylesterase